MSGLDVEFRILGPLELSRDGYAAKLGPRRQRSLLAVLLLHANEVISSERLIDEIWGEKAPASAANMIQVYVSRLRRALGSGLLLTRPTGYLLQVSEGQLDAARFASALTRAGEAMRSGDPAAARGLLDGALALWRGPPLADFAHESFAQGEVARLEELHLEALELRIDADLATGRHARLAGEIERLIADHPFRERLRGQLMLALYRSGRQADALEAYREARRTLVDELGIEPGTALQHLEQAILAQDPDLLSPTRERAPTVEGVGGRTVGNLPPELTSLIGRDPDIARVADLVSHNRLVAVVGPGGVGKTRLARRIGANLANDFQDGVWFVDLAAIDRAGDVGTAVLSATRIADRAGVTSLDTVADQLSGRRLLLLLDNCEHVARSAAEVAERLLGECPDVRILATSREPLAIAGEHVARLEPLATTAEGTRPPAAVELFLDRAASHGVSWEESATVLTAIEQICERLDGIPLAIELAAGRSRAISPADLLARLDDRLRLLARPRRSSAQDRQVTLEAAIDWSYGLLGLEEQATLRRLSVFHGGFTVAAAAAACADLGTELDTLDRVTALVDRSVITVDRAGGEARYRLLESIALFAEERLREGGEAEQARDRHARFFLTFAEAARNRLDGHDQVTGGELLDAEQDNVTAALAWCLRGDGDPTVGAGLAAALGWHWMLRGRPNVAQHWLERARELRDGVDPLTLVGVHVANSALTYSTSDLEASRTSATEAVAIARKTDDPDLLAEALAQLAFSFQGMGSETEAVAVTAELRSLEPRLAAPRARVVSHLACAQVALYTGNLERASADASSAREIARQAGDHLRAAWSGYWLTHALAAGSGIPAARAAITDATRDAVRSGYELAVVDILIGATTLAMADDDLDTARRLLPEVAGMLREQQRWDDLGGSLRIAAAADLRLGFPERSAILLGAAERRTDHIDAEHAMLLSELASLRDQLTARLGTEAFERGYEAGATLGLDQVVGLISAPQWSGRVTELAG